MKLLAAWKTVDEPMELAQEEEHFFQSFSKNLHFSNFFI
jgi:hypothetical protein